MTDPRGIRAVCSGANHQFLDALYDRVVILDGAFGTWMQAQDLGPEDFGGEALEGCNEYLVLTRPDLVTRMHDDFFAVGVDAVETATFGAFPLVLTEYGIAEQTFEINRHAAELAREVASAYSTPDRPRWVVGSIGPGTRLPSLGQIPYVEFRDGYTAQVDGLLAGGIDVVLVETVYDLLQAKAAINGAKAAMAKVGVLLPLIVQVTVETTGRMLVGTEIGAALTALEAMRPDVIGMNCRDRAGRDDRTPALSLATRAHVPLGAAERGAPVGRRRRDLLQPLVRGAGRGARSQRGRVRPQHRRRLLRHDGRALAGRRRTHRRARAGDTHTGVRAGSVVDLLARAVPSGARVPSRWASARMRTARRSSARRCSPPTGTRACRWRANR